MPKIYLFNFLMIVSFTISHASDTSDDTPIAESLNIDCGVTLVQLLASEINNSGLRHDVYHEEIDELDEDIHMEESDPAIAINDTTDTSTPLKKRSKRTPAKKRARSDDAPTKKRLSKRARTKAPSSNEPAEISCRYCQSVFKTRYFSLHLRAHARQIEKNICPYDNQQFPSKEALEGHLKEPPSAHVKIAATPKMETCPFCKKICKLNGLKTHLKTHTNEVENHICPYDRQRFKDAEALELHLSEACLREPVSAAFRREKPKAKTINTEEKKYFCKICLTGFARETNMKTHMKNKHEDAFECEEKGCDKKFSNAQELAFHMREEHTGTHVCDIDGCTRSFKTHKDLINHQFAPPHGNSFKCHKRTGLSICGQIFPTKEELVTHQAEPHVPPIKKRVTKKLDEYRCRECDEICKDEDDLDVHERIHFPYFCTEKGCQSKYVKKYRLNRHIESVHSNIKFACNAVDCEAAYTSESALHKHKEDKHPGEYLFNCNAPDCGTAFSKHKDLVEHKSMHKKYVCKEPGCTEGFNDMRLLVAHERDAHTEPKAPRKRTSNKRSPNKEHPCEEPGCTETFDVFSKLKSHQRDMHPKNICPICERDFKYPSRLARHTSCKKK